MWCKCFENGRESVKYSPYSAATLHNTQKQVEHVQAVINENLELTTTKLEALGILQVKYKDANKEYLHDMCAQNSFHTFCHEARRNFVLKLHRSGLKALTINHIP